MDLSRIAGAVSVEALGTKVVGIVGAGGVAGNALNLVRCGVERFRIMDFDVVSAPNIARQHHDFHAIGMPKVEALREAMLRINPEVSVACYREDATRLSDAELDDRFGGCDLMIWATDRHKAQAAGNRYALRTDTPTVWLGLYPGAQGGEIAFWHPAIVACYRCLMKKRYEAHEAAEQEGDSLDPPSDDCTIMDITLVDAIGCDIEIGILTRGSDNRRGRLITELGQRNFIQVQLDPGWTLNGVSPVRSYLGVSDESTGFFAWNAVVRADPSAGFPSCPDCEEFRGAICGHCHGIPIRMRPAGLPRPSTGR